MGLLRIVAGLSLAVIAAAYYGLGALFMLGDTRPHGMAISSGVFGLFGFCGPLILLGLHIALASPNRSMRSRKVMLGLAAAVLIVVLAGMAPQLFYEDTRLEMAELMLKTVVWSAVCAVPIIRSWLNGMADRRA